MIDFVSQNDNLTSITGTMAVLYFLEQLKQSMTNLPQVIKICLVSLKTLIPFFIRCLSKTPFLLREMASFLL